jgi:hypothetical protein
MDKYFIITIDTEGDNLWGVTDIKEKITVRNANYLYRFQELCEKFNFIPTYLVNYEMALAEPMIEMGREGIKKRSLEIGAHIHSWNQPPFFYIRKGIGKRGKPYLGEYPAAVIVQKIDYLTKMLEDTFQVAITSHRGGRWYFDSRILEELNKLNYLVDCSCTPGVNWNKKRGWSLFSKGCDWSQIPNEPFYFRTTYGKKILEIPVTIESCNNHQTNYWFRPNGTNEKEMVRLIRENKNEYIEFMIHSSELMQGGSPTFKREWQISKLYYDLEMIFSELQKSGYIGIGISDYAKRLSTDYLKERKL